MLYPDSHYSHSLEIRSISSPFNHSEKALHQWWCSLPLGEGIKTEDGDLVYLIQRGNKNTRDGPDILSVSLFNGKKVLVGDLEFHQREQDWFTHGHHLDARYNRVILHGVFHLGPCRAMTSSGEMISTVVIQKGSMNKDNFSNCRLVNKVYSSKIHDRLAPLIHYRWQMKVKQMYENIERVRDFREAFYRETFRALGLKGNEDLFEKIANKVPFAFWETVPCQSKVTSYLFSFASLKGQHSVELKKYPEFNMSHKSEVDLNTSGFPLVKFWEWKRKGIRPMARPERRLALGTIIIWALKRGWKPWEPSHSIQTQKIMEEVKDQLASKGWMAEWLGNVIYPFRAAVLLYQNEIDTQNFDGWYQLKTGYIYRKVAKQFSSLIDKSLLSHFSIQQGLLALRQRYCHLQLCGVCPLK